MKAKAFSPGHITGFFEICGSDDILAKGSRGAGMCTTLGATSAVTVCDSSRQAVAVKIDGAGSRAEVTKHAVRRMIGGDRLKVSISTDLDLPQSQGFGMSAAGALSSALALADTLGRTRQEAFEAAHIAEIECGCGLGDVSAIHRGGITIRVRPGLPPTGKVLRIRGEPELVLAVVGKRLLTKSVLSDPVKRVAIIRSGAVRVDALARRPSIERLMELSASFAVESGLASRKIRLAMCEADKHGSSSMAMLGNSVFATGDTPMLRKALKRFGDVRVCKVDGEGPTVF